MIFENITEGMQVCNAYQEHVTVLRKFDSPMVGCSDGYVWEAEDLDVADHSYSHLGAK